MKSRNFLVILIIALAGFLVWWRIHRPANQANHQPDQPDTNQAQASQLPSTPPSSRLAKVPVADNSQPTPGSNFTAWNEKRMEQMSNANQTMLNEWRTPIEFYGVVEDESSSVISGAHVDFDCNDLSSTGTSFYHTESDANGAFSIRNITGKLLGVKVGKEGYYTYHPNGDDFYYAGQNQNFVPDPGNPVVFRLRKKGAGEALIHFHKNFRVPRDGTPVLVDLATGNLTQSSENSLVVECWTGDDVKKQGWKYDWKCQVSVPGGGLQIYSEQFPFLAPQDGYVLSDLIDMTVTNNVSWAYDVQHNYYIHTTAGNFGRIVFGMIAGGDNFCVIDSYFNPSGSRNLEPAQ
jgi:hypothetical protein